jgi:transcriptional regulator with XRE-family HTH domain
MITAEQLKAARKRLGWSQLALSLGASVAQKTGVGFEAGKMRLSAAAHSSPFAKPDSRLLGRTSVVTHIRLKPPLNYHDSIDHSPIDFSDLRRSVLAACLVARHQMIPSPKERMSITSSKYINSFGMRFFYSLSF